MTPMQYGGAIFYEIYLFPIQTNITCAIKDTLNLCPIIGCLRFYLFYSKKVTNRP